MPRDSCCFCSDCSLPALCNGVNFSLILYIWFVTFSIPRILVMNYTTQWKQLQNKTKTHHMWSANQDSVKQNWMLCSHGFLSVVKVKMHAQKHHFCKLLKKSPYQYSLENILVTKKAARKPSSIFFFFFANTKEKCSLQEHGAEMITSIPFFSFSNKSRLGRRYFNKCFILPC